MTPISIDGGRLWDRLVTRLGRIWDLYGGTLTCDTDIEL
jgi:hypothetical protein